MNKNDPLKTYTEEALRHYAGSAYSITLLDETDSTNEVLRTLALSGAPEKTAVFAKAQRAGQGRRGRSFFSPGGSGLYFSVLLRPQKLLDPAKITLTAGVAAAEAAEELLGLSLKLKWVNDLYKGDRKVGGILAKSALTCQGAPDYCILGWGINLFAPPEGFGELAPIADALLEQREDALFAPLGAKILQNFFARYEQEDFEAVLTAFEQRSYLLGKTVTARLPKGAVKGTVLGLDREGGLKLQTEEGIRILSSGEVCLEDYR